MPYKPAPTRFLKSVKTKRTVRNGASRHVLHKFEITVPSNYSQAGLTAGEIDSLPDSFPFAGLWGEQVAWFLTHPQYAGHWGDLDASYYVGVLLTVFTDGTILCSDSHRGEYLLDGSSLMAGSWE